VPREIGKRMESNFDQGKSEGSGRIVKTGSSAVAPGWASDRRPKGAKTGGSIRRFTLEKGEEVLVRFVEPDPFTSYWQHWINKVAYVCLINECPLCEIDDTPGPVDCFNVIKMAESGPEILLWQMSADPSNALKERMKSPRYSPVNRLNLYFAISKTSPDKGYPKYSIDPVKDTELQEDWGVEPLTQEQVDEIAKGAYTSDVVRERPRHELQELVNKMED
jgi:hypothetical protein